MKNSENYNKKKHRHLNVPCTLPQQKFDSPVFNPGTVPLVSNFVFLLNKSRYKNKCGGDLPKSPTTSSLEDLSPNMLHNIDGPTN